MNAPSILGVDMRKNGDTATFVADTLFCPRTAAEAVGAQNTTVPGTYVFAHCRAIPRGQIVVVVRRGDGPAKAISGRARRGSGISPSPRVCVVAGPIYSASLTGKGSLWTTAI